MRSILVVLVSFSIAAGSTANAQPLEDVASLEAFFDGAVPAFLEAHDAPGMTVSVVKDGRLLLAKGYGVATHETREPVVADRTLFRIGSVSKIFLATALMQLVEQGRLDLDTDLNRYLEGIEIPATFQQPITLRHVMTHTAGFEDSMRDVFVPPEEFRPLRETLTRYLPKRVRPPGELISYSNHATALAGLVVEQVAGESYDDYVDRHILAPLGMTHTTTRQPLPEALAADASTGTRPADYFTYVGIPPAGSVSSTATDMAKFMIAHLQLGRLDGARILQEETARRMQTRLFTLDDRVNGLAHQFFEHELGGVRMIGHGGGMVTHITMMALLPAEGVGFFASVNAQSGAPAHLQRLFLERYFPATRPARPEPMAGAAERLERYTGWYSESRSGVHHFTKIGRFLTTKRAIAGDDAQLDFLGERWVETEPSVFRRVDGPEWLVFQDDGEGRVVRALRGLVGASVLLREPAWKGLTAQRTLGVGIVLLLLWPLLHRPLWRTRRWWGGARAGGVTGVARWVSAGLRVTAMLFVVSFAWGATTLALDLGGGFPGTMLLATTLPFGIAPLVIGGAVCCVLLWRGRHGTLRERLGYTGLVLGGLGLLWWTNYWNVLITRL